MLDQNCQTRPHSPFASRIPRAPAERVSRPAAQTPPATGRTRGVWRRGQRQTAGRPPVPGSRQDSGERSGFEENADRDPHPGEPVLAHQFLNRSLNYMINYLIQLCTTKFGREYLRSKNTYVILRELHKWEKSENVMVVLEHLVNIIIRYCNRIAAKPLSFPLSGSFHKNWHDFGMLPSLYRLIHRFEHEIGYDNLKEVEVPEEIASQFKDLEQLSWSIISRHITGDGINIYLYSICVGCIHRIGTLYFRIGQLCQCLPD